MLSAAAAVSFLTAASAAEKVYKPGDISRNGTIDGFDIRLMKIGLLQGTLSNDIPLSVSDLNTDGAMNAADLSLLKQLYLKPAAISPQPQAKNPIWSDEFDDSAVNPANWSYALGNWMTDDDGNFITSGWGNDEQQFYTDQNASVHDGILTIAARQENHSDPAQGTYSYTSARLSTQHKFSVCGGRVEVRARCDEGKSLWPAIWMLPEDSFYGTWAASGEIDIMEGWGSTPEKICGTLHFGDVWPNNQYVTKEYQFPDGKTTNDWHTYAIEWQRGEIRWYVDDVLYSTQTDWYSVDRDSPAPFDQNFYLILNLAVGGKFDGIDEKYADPAVFANGEKHFDIDYVRVYDLADGFSATRLTSLYLDTHLEGGDAVITDRSNYNTFDIYSTGSYPSGVAGMIRNTSFRKGQTYTLSFDVSSSVSREMAVSAEDSSRKCWLNETFSIGTSPKHFRCSLTVPEDMQLDIYFQLGDIGGASRLGSHKVTISNIKLVES